MTALAPAIGGSATGTLPSAHWADDTGTGTGWNGTVGISPLTFTGTWKAASGATALTTTAAGSYTDTQDGVYYTVKVTASTTTTTTFSWSSNDTTDKTGGTAVVATNGTAKAVGTKGVSIDFPSATAVAVGSDYTVVVGTLGASSLTVDTTTAAAITSVTTTSPPPAYVNTGLVIPAGSTVGTVDSAGAVKVLSAAAGTGASGTGYYTAAPGASITADKNSWAKTYTGTLVYSIVSGP